MQFRSDALRDVDLLEQYGQNIDSLDEHEVIQRGGIGDDDHVFEEGRREADSRAISSAEMV